MKQAGNFLFNVMQYVVGWRFECRILSNIYIYIYQETTLRPLTFFPF